MNAKRIDTEFLGSSPVIKTLSILCSYFSRLIGHLIIDCFQEINHTNEIRRYI